MADQKSYAPGQTAKLLIRGAEMDATVLVTKEAQSIGWHQVMRIKAGQAIEVPVTDADIGDTWVNIAFLKDDKLYRAERKLRVPEVSRGLQVSITAEQAVAKPREPGVFTIKTTDASGAPVRAQVSLAVVDEAVFAVKPDETPDPVRFFYRREYSRVSTSFSREYSFIGYSGPDGLTLAHKISARRRPLALADFKGDKEARPHVRKEFPDAIYWIADLVTDESGTATAKVTYPDALTTWRLTARAITADTRAGCELEPDHDDEGRDPARHHAAIPDRRRHRARADGGAQLSAGCASDDGVGRSEEPQADRRVGDDAAAGGYRVGRRAAS